MKDDKIMMICLCTVLYHMIKHSKEKTLQFVNHTHYVGKTFAIYPQPLILSTNYQVVKGSVVKHSHLAIIHKTANVFPLECFIV